MGIRLDAFRSGLGDGKRSSGERHFRCEAGHAIFASPSQCTLICKKASLPPPPPAKPSPGDRERKKEEARQKRDWQTRAAAVGVSLSGSFPFATAELEVQLSLPTHCATA